MGGYQDRNFPLKLYPQKLGERGRVYAFKEMHEAAAAKGKAAGSYFHLKQNKLIKSPE